ncbi:MAG: HNH endonuclease [Bacteroidetes bacterium]|nr:HNH endonuclease [Bacteroidota bacterium]
MILIHQKINNIRYFTHLVTPIDNLIREGDRPRYPNGRKVRIIAQADLNIPINSTLWDTINFAGISQGNACRVDNITNIKNTEEFQLDVWERFRPYFVAYDQISISTTLAVISELQNTIPDLIVTEGGLKLVSHIVKERNGKIVAAKKQQAIENNLLFCEVCEFSFPKIYQSNFIECHHLTPIGQHGERETTLDDLSLVCSNCHRMLHKKFNENYFSIQELKDHIKICANKLI